MCETEERNSEIVHEKATRAFIFQVAHVLKKCVQIFWKYSIFLCGYLFTIL
jgi:hypothetical protein